MKDTLYYETINTTFGPLFVAAGAKGIYSVCYLIGHAEYDSDVCDKDLIGEAEAIKQLTKDYPTADISHNPEEVTVFTKPLVDFLSNRAPWPQLPFVHPDNVGAFHLRAWKAMREIPVGQSCTYHELAKKLSSPKAARAVGHACSKNKMAVVIPCHRVLSKSGKGGGYRWGLKRKGDLLALESENNP